MSIKQFIHIDSYINYMCIILRDNNTVTEALTSYTDENNNNDNLVSDCIVGMCKLLMLSFNNVNCTDTSRYGSLL